ncbi:MAG TPA: bifunctional DNA-formamidopyrimidine glycosylase/DNA-(apurinic or apyrimidinic site) lyase [Nevskiaceae bacterium]
MPELPEVETIRRGLEASVVEHRIVRVLVREPRLRQPIPADLAERLAGRRILSVARRGKYLLVHTDGETLLIHLGMSGRLWTLQGHPPAGPHDHVDLQMEDGRTLRFHDPRRFGLMLLCEGDCAGHPLLAGIGPEPLSVAFSGAYLWERSRGHHVAIKSFLMDSHVVAGIGNIYASEALYLARIHPARQVMRIARPRYDTLVTSIRATLDKAIGSGGTTLRDFSHVDGTSGYFGQRLDVYGRAGEPCRRCGSVIVTRRIGQRSSFYCPRCQR